MSSLAYRIQATMDQCHLHQRDDAERNAWVRLMKEIYSKAEVVKVWLGEPTNGSDVALEIMGRLLDEEYNVDLWEDPQWE